MKKINRALISVSNKTGLTDLAKELVGFGVDIISTGGTAKLLRNSGVNIRDASDLTGFPEIWLKLHRFASLNGWPLRVNSAG